MRLSGFLAFTVWSLTASAGSAEVFIERIDPPSFKRGETTRVSVVGSDLGQAIGLWTSPGRGWIQTKRVPEQTSRAVFDITISPEAELGLFGLRVATRSGLSNVHLFVIDDLAVQPEVERGNEATSRPLAEAQRVALPTAIAGVCGAVDVDRFGIQVKAGQSVTFEVVGSRLGKAFDPLITVRDLRGRIVVQQDNDIGLFFDCRFEHTFETAGDYLVELRDARFGGSEHWTYVLRMGSFPVARVALPSAVRPGNRVSLMFPQLGGRPLSLDVPKQSGSGILSFALRRADDDASAWMPLLLSDLNGTLEREPNDERERPTLATVPGLLHGIFARPGDRDWFALDLKKGQTLEIRTETRTFGSPADVELVLFGPDGKELKRADDSGFEDASLSYTTKVDGRHCLLIRELLNSGGTEFVYRVEVRERAPSLELNSGIARMAIPQGTHQPLPLTVKRAGLSGDVHLSLVGGPPGVSIKSPTIEKSVSDADNAILVDKTAPAGIYTLQLVARMQKDGQIMALGRTHPLIDRLPTGRGPHGEPFELREDQRRLPVTLTDRIALLIIPPAPFDFEIVAESHPGHSKGTAEPEGTPLVMLARYLQARFQIKTKRAGGFDGPIRFSARGGELERERLRAARVSSEIPNATADQPLVTAELSSHVLTKLVKHRVTVTGLVEHQGSRIALTRTFDLQIRVAFQPSASAVRIRPGATTTVRIHAGRLAAFAGPVTVSPRQISGLTLPETITIPAGADAVEVKLHAAADIKPKKYSVPLVGSARVGKFQESAKGQPLEVIVSK